MAYGDPYVTVEELKARGGIKLAVQDAVLSTVILGACQAIDEMTGTQFNRTPDATILVVGGPNYRRSGYDRFDVECWVDVPEGVVSLDLVETGDGSGTFPTIWTADDWELGPDNRRPGFPATELWRTRSGAYSFPYGRGAIRLTGVFGWPSVPAGIKSATYLLAHRHLERWNASFGVAGGGELGTNVIAIPGVDKDVLALVKPFIVGGVI